jgi:hypothetical protein
MTPTWWPVWPALKLPHILAMVGHMGVCGGFVELCFAQFGGRQLTQPFKVWPRGLKIQASIPKGVGSSPVAGICSNRVDSKWTRQNLMSIRIEHMRHIGGQHTPRQHATIFLAPAEVSGGQPAQRR